MTVFASRETFWIRRTLATEPARCVGPCITLASSSTSPSSFGNPPYPTESSFGSSSTTVTAATTASSVSPPFFRMSMPLSSACSPLALEIISGRFPCAAGARFERAARLPFERAPPNNLPALATALPASEVRKNLRRDQSSMGNPSSISAPQYTTLARPRLSGGFGPLGNACLSDSNGGRLFLAGNGGDGLRGKFAFPARNHHARKAIPKNSKRGSPQVHELIDRAEWK